MVGKDEIDDAKKHYVPVHTMVMNPSLAHVTFLVHCEVQKYMALAVQSILV